MERIFAFSDPVFREGYDVRVAVIAEAHTILLPLDVPTHGLLSDDLMRDSLAATQKQWPALADELRAGKVIGFHGSPRRFGPEVRYCVCRDGLQNVARDEWLALALSLVEAEHDRNRLDAYRRIGKRFSYAAFEASAQPDRLAAALSRDLVARLDRAGEKIERELGDVLDDLAILGHPFFLVDGGKGKTGWFGHYAYVSPRSGEPPRACSLTMQISYDACAPPAEEPSRVRRAQVEIWATDPDKPPPGFPTQ